MSKYQNFGKVSMISFGIMLLYMAFNSANNIESELISDDGFGQLGFILLAVLYLNMGIGSLISTAVINKGGTKTCLILGGIGCII